MKMSHCVILSVVSRPFAMFKLDHGSASPELKQVSSVYECHGYISITATSLPQALRGSRSPKTETSAGGGLDDIQNGLKREP